MSVCLKKILTFFLSLFFCFSLSAAGKQSSQIIKSGHWIYDDMELLSAESKNTMFLEIQPLSVGEIRFYLKCVDYEALSSSGKAVYKRVSDFINDDDDFFPNSSLRLFLNARLNPEVFYKSNADINWSFSPNFKDNPITFPIIIGFSDYLTIQSDLSIGKSPVAAAKPDNFMNISFDLGDYDMYIPNFAYFSGTKVFNDWGISAHMGKEGMRIGNTSLGSILYNDTFKSDFYFQLNLFTERLKFSMDITQFNKDKYLYLHQLTLRPFKNFNIGVLEGTLITAPFELRFLNPLMIMHQFTGWWDYDFGLNEFYGQSNFCAYLGFTVEYMPIKNLRIYGLYAQNEILDFGTTVGGNASPAELSYPDSIGAQLGVEYFIPLKNNSHIKTGVEALYTSPYLYVKHSPIWSMIRTERAGGHTLASWLGSPAGPDSFMLQASAEYDSNEKWKAGIEYDFSIHGENTVNNLFNKDKYLNKNNLWTYYPSVQYSIAENEKDADKMDAAVKRARNMWMTGIHEYKNDIRINGSYEILDNLNVYGQFSYSFIFNNKNILDNFAQGVELALAVTYEIF